jgi:hypothetical protein
MLLNKLLKSATLPTLPMQQPHQLVILTLSSNHVFARITQIWLPTGLNHPMHGIGYATALIQATMLQINLISQTYHCVSTPQMHTSAVSTWLKI